MTKQLRTRKRLPSSADSYFPVKFLCWFSVRCKISKTLEYNMASHTKYGFPTGETDSVDVSALKGKVLRSLDAADSHAERHEP